MERPKPGNDDERKGVTPPVRNPTQPPKPVRVRCYGRSD
jgi:hypothetical protein